MKLSQEVVDKLLGLAGKTLDNGIKVQVDIITPRGRRISREEAKGEVREAVNRFRERTGTEGDSGVR